MLRKTNQFFFLQQLCKTITIITLKHVDGWTGYKGKAEHYCHPRELANLLANYERWSLGVELALAFNVAIVMALVVFMLCNKKPGGGSSCILNCCSTGAEPKKEYHHLVPTTTNKSNNLVVEVYTDDHEDDEPESNRHPITENWRS